MLQRALKTLPPLKLPKKREQPTLRQPSTPIALTIRITRTRLAPALNFLLGIAHAVVRTDSAAEGDAVHLQATEVALPPLEAGTDAIST